VDMMKTPDHSIDDAGVGQWHASINIQAPELTVFLGYNNVHLLSYLCDWFDCPNVFEYKTIGRGSELLANVWVNMLGATTPSLLRTCLPEEAVGGGYTSRGIFVLEEDKGRLVVVPGIPNEIQTDKDIARVQKKLETDEKALIHDLKQILAIQGAFREGPGFREAYYDFRIACEQRVAKTAKMQGYEGRRPLHTVKLAMVLSASRSNDRIVTAEDLVKAVDLLEQTEIKMPRTFLGVGANPLASAQEDMKTWMATVKKAHIKDIVMRYQSDLTMDEIRKVILVVQTLGLVKYDPVSDIAYWAADGEFADVRKRREDSRGTKKSRKDNGEGHSGGWSSQPVD